MFEALKKEDYETAWKYWDPKKERSVEKLKKFLEHGEIPIITDFEIVWVEVFDFKRKDNPLITVYVNINHQEPPLALLVRYDELILYQH